MPCGPDHCNHCAGLTAGRFDEKGMNNNAKQVEMKIMVLINIYLLCICVFCELDNSAPSNCYGVDEIFIIKYIIFLYIILEWSRALLEG